jgi:hypothetical protein|tara:strand:- start:22 stop:540 length:519 start_codon:yes stop_codon:yes gene_type:complete
MKLKDKPLTERQLKFAHLYALDGGLKSNTEIAIESGYPKASAYQRAHELLNEEICPHVVKYINEIRKDVDRKFDLDAPSHRKKLFELRDHAIEKGMLGVALRAEELRGKTKGLYVDYSKTMNVDVNSQEFKDFVKMKNMTADELAEEMQKLEDKYKKGDETYDPEAHKEADD